MSEAKETAARSGAGARIAKKLVMPLVATAVSAVASYAAKRGPELLEKKVLPKLRDVGRESGRAAATVPERAKATLDSAGDLAEGLTERVRTVAEGGGRGRAERRAMSSTEREKQRAERAERRAARRRRSPS